MLLQSIEYKCKATKYEINLMNLALGKQTKQSSTFGGDWVSGNAVDGKTSESCTHTGMWDFLVQCSN